MMLASDSLILQLFFQVRHGPVISHILDTAITCTGPQDPRLFTLLENDEMAQVG